MRAWWRHLFTLYGYLREKPRTAEKLMSDYIASTGARLQELTAGIGEALEAAVKARLKEVKSHPRNRQLADMINYVSDMTAVMAAIVVAGMV